MTFYFLPLPFLQYIFVKKSHSIHASFSSFHVQFVARVHKDPKKIYFDKLNLKNVESTSMYINDRPWTNILCLAAIFLRLETTFSWFAWTQLDFIKLFHLLLKKKFRSVISLSKARFCDFFSQGLRNIISWMCIYRITSKNSPPLSRWLKFGLVNRTGDRSLVAAQGIYWPE